MVKSPKKRLIGEDVQKSLRNALIFAGPALLVLIGSTIEVIPKDLQYGALVLYLLNFITDLFRKWLAENKY